MAGTLGWPTTPADIRAATRWAAEDYPDEVLDPIAQAAVSMIEARVGPWSGQELVHTTVHGRIPAEVVILPWPIAAVSSVTVDDVAVTPREVEYGCVYLDVPATGTIVITATARASATAPPEVKLAGRALAAFLARQEIVSPNLPGNRRAGTDGADTDVLQGFALPRRVSEMIRPYVLAGGFA